MRSRLICFVAFVLMSSGLTDAEEKRIAVVSAHTGHFYFIAPKTNLNQQGSASFSLDGNTVAFDARESGEAFSTIRILLTKADGSQKEPTNLCSGAMPSYSKSGKRIAFSRPGGGVLVIDADGKNEKSISRNAWHIVFSPVDEDIVAYGMGNDIEVRNLKTDDTYRLMPEDNREDYSQIIWNFQWSPDGKTIAFSGRKPQGGRVVAQVGTEDGNELHEVLAAEAHFDRLCFHPQTKELFFTAKSSAQRGWGIFSLNVKAPLEFRQPIYFPNQPQGRINRVTGWSDDGTLLLISTNKNDGELETTPDDFNQSVKPRLGAVAQLKRGRELVRTEKFGTFIDEIMSGVPDEAKPAAVEHISENSEYWLILLAEAIDRFDEAEKIENKITIPLELNDSELNLIFEDEEWRLTVK